MNSSPCLILNESITPTTWCPSSTPLWMQISFSIALTSSSSFKFFFTNDFTAYKAPSSFSWRYTLHDTPWPMHTFILPYFFTGNRRYAPLPSPFPSPRCPSFRNRLRTHPISFSSLFPYLSFPYLHSSPRNVLFSLNDQSCSPKQSTSSEFPLSAGGKDGRTTVSVSFLPRLV